MRVSIEVAADGTLTSARARGGDAVFVAAALAAVRRGRFEAARDAHGQPVASTTTVVVVFRLDE